jgi:hypothetical protein
MATVTAGKILGMNSLTYLPTNYDPAKAYPVLIFMPGAGEIGTNASLLTVHGPFLYLKQGVDLGIDLIVIAIQNQTQNPRPSEMAGYVTAVNSLYKTTGIIGTGLSRGGQDWEWYANNNEGYLQTIKGLVVFSSQGTVADQPGIPGTFNPSLYKKYNIPIWRGEGDQDFTWDINNGSNNALAAVAPNLAIWTVWKGAGHGDPVWSDGYNPKWVNNSLKQSIYTWAASLAPTGTTPPPPPTTYYNVAVSGTFTKNDCPTGSISTSVSGFGIAAGTYSSTISQADADGQAQAALQTQGQTYANANGVCTPTTPPPTKTIVKVVIYYSDGTTDTQPS